MVQTIKNLSAVQETQVPSLGQEDSLEKEMAIHFSILTWRLPWTEEPGGLRSMGSPRVRHDWANNTHTYNFKQKSSVLFILFCSLTEWLNWIYFMNVVLLAALYSTREGKSLAISSSKNWHKENEVLCTLICWRTWQNAWDLSSSSLYIRVPVTQLVKNLPEMRETWVRSLGWEDLLEKGKPTHSSILTWRIPWPV